MFSLIRLISGGSFARLDCSKSLKLTGCLLIMQSGVSAYQQWGLGAIYAVPFICELLTFWHIAAVVDFAKCLFHAVPDHCAISGLVPGGITKESTFSGNAQTAQWALTRLDIISKHSKTQSTMRTLSKHSHAPFILFVVVSYRNVSASFWLILKLSPSYISNWQ